MVVYFICLIFLEQVQKKLDFSQYFVAYICLNGLQYTKCEMWYIIFYLFTNTLIVFYEYQLICSNISISSAIEMSAWRVHELFKSFAIIFKFQNNFNTVYEFCPVVRHYKLFNLERWIFQWTILTRGYMHSGTNSWSLYRSFRPHIVKL